MSVADTPKGVLLELVTWKTVFAAIVALSFF